MQVQLYYLIILVSCVMCYPQLCLYLPYSGKVWQGETFSEHLVEKVWQMNRVGAQAIIF